MSIPCTRCGEKPSTYFRAYSGERLCNDCFNDTILDRVKRTINKYKMFEWDSRIAIGVSGGKDSLTLLHLLHEIESKRPKAELIAICVDEGVSGYRDEALRIAENNCRQLDIEMHTVSFKDLFDETMDQIAVKERKLGTCSYCGVLRRRALNEAAKEVGADRLATGHNLDDMAQSVMLNILRGDINRIDSFDPAGQQLGEYIRRVKPLCMIFRSGHHPGRCLLTQDDAHLVTEINFTARDIVIPQCQIRPFQGVLQSLLTQTQETVCQ